MIERKANVISGLFMFIQRLQPIKEYPWMVNIKVVESHENNCGFNSHGLKNCQIGMVSTASFMEPTRTFFLDTTMGLREPQTSAAWTTIATAAQNNFLEVARMLVPDIGQCSAKN